MSNRGRFIVGTAAAMLCGVGFAEPPAPDKKLDMATPAQLFGQREDVIDISLSPDGKHVVLVAPGPGISTYAIVMDADTHAAKPVFKQDGKPLNIVSCGWTSNSRIACKLWGVSFANGPAIPYSRTIAVDMDGKNPTYLGKATSMGARISQFDGDIVDWRQGDGSVLMTRDYVPGEDDRTGSDLDGLGVDLVDTTTGKSTRVEKADRSASEYLSDGQGTIRIRASLERDDAGLLTGATTYLYRQAGDRQWRTFSRTKPNTNEFKPIAVDGTRNLAYAVKTLNGRDTIYSVALDGSFKAELIASHSDVDVHNVITIGRRGRVIGTSYTTDRRQTDYFDPDYKRISLGLAKALPEMPLIHFVSASADEQRLVIFAGSDTDPGHYLLYDRTTHHLDELLPARDKLTGTQMAPMKSVSFKAADGTNIPAYLTLPIGGASKGLPAIVMPHGGPAYRDEWGFDWLVQFFAQRGYAVLQPEYRGSTGYGDAFYAQNGFKSWQTAMGDICDAGRWLLKEGIADPGKLAIVGWSYGGYAALQANVVQPDLFKAIVAVAPVTDLGRVKSEARDYTNSWLVAQEVGSGDVVSQGSPARHADRIVSPVMIFHGDHDLNVSVAQAKLMDQALRRAGKKTTLVVYPGLDHQLDDSAARADMLTKADEFLRASLHM